MSPSSTAPTPSNATSATAPSISEVPTTAPVGDASDPAALDTVRAFLYATQQASVEQNVTLLSPFVSDSCQCIDVTKKVIKNQRDDQQRLESDELRSIDVRVADRTSNALIVRATYVAPGYRLLGSDGKVVETVHSMRVSADVTLQFVGNRWLVTKFEAAG
ncbi:MAG: hypothetical protein JWM93_1928 [Frankiales bacterium]|nr:hypothetical protein [Frankiales bacterium]